MGRRCRVNKRNGYLRQREFHQWATGLGERLSKQDNLLDAIVKKITDHGERLAVMADRDSRKDRADDQSTAWKHTATVVIAGIISTAIAVLAALIEHYWR